MIEIAILVGIIVFLTIAIVFVYKKYSKPCAVCGSTTCPGCPPSYDLTSVCDISQSRLTDTSSLLTGLSLVDVNSSPDLQETMYSFCDDAHIAKTLCPTLFSQYQSMYTTLCAPAPLVTQAIFRSEDIPANATPEERIEKVRDERVKDEREKDNKVRNDNKLKNDSLCKIQSSLSPCVCEAGQTRGTKSWTSEYKNKAGTSCTQTPEIKAKMSCNVKQNIPCVCN